MSRAMTAVRNSAERCRWTCGLSRKNAEESEASKAGKALKERVADSSYDPIAWLASKLRRRGAGDQG
jgi:hypothetical protein